MMPSRAVTVIFDNRMSNDFALEKVEAHLDHGRWVTEPPDFVGDLSEWRSESHGLLTGTEGGATYRIKRDLDELLSVKMHWDNPFAGDNSYSCSAAPAGDADGSGFSIGFTGGDGDDATVRFILLSGKCFVETSSGAVICTAHAQLTSDTAHYAAIWELRGSVSWQAHHNLVASEYQQVFDAMASKGYRLVDLSGHYDGTADRYAALWEQRSGLPWAAHHGLDQDGYQRQFDDLLRQSFRPVRVNCHVAGDAVRYSAIWEQRSGAEWQARHGLTEAQYQQTFDTLVADGFKLIDVSVCGTPTGDRFMGLWERSSGTDWQARHGLDSAAYQQTFDSLGAQGFRLVHVCGYHSSGEDRFAAIWERRGGPPSEAHHNQDARLYQATFDALATRGLGPVRTSVYG